MVNITSAITSIVMGALSGWIASRIMKKNGSLLYYIVIGIVGSFLGGFLFGFLGFSAHSLTASIVVSVAGACLLIFILNKLFKK